MARKTNKETAGPTADADAAIEFLHAFLGDAPWPLTAILPKHVSPGETARIRAVGMFGADTAKEAAAWIKKWNADHEIYFQPNPLKGPLSSAHKRASKNDVKAAACLFVDGDYPKQAGVSIQNEQAAMIKRLREINPRPTWIINSGTGVWGFWTLREPVPLDGANGATTQMVEQCGMGLEELFGKRWADSCRNVDRIARLPGTVNWKLAVMSYVVEYHQDRAYGIEDFTRRVRGDYDPAPDIELSADLPPSDVDALPIDAETKELIHDGQGDQKSRSHAVFRVTAVMLRAGCDHDRIAAVLLDPSLGISVHCLSQPNPRRAVGRAIANAVRSNRPGDDAPEFSESAIALMFAEQHAHDLRYVSAWGRWMRWDGARWAHEETLWAQDLVHDLARAMARSLDASRNNRTGGRALGNSKTVQGSERLARADRRFAATVGQWDNDPWLLNTPDGVVDLKTGDVRPGEPDDYMTKITGTGVDPKCSVTRWLSVLDRSMDGDADMVAYLKRLFGYSLTGLTCEEMFAFFFGEGANGKTKIVEAVAGCMGDYHAHTPMETFLTSRNDRHPTEIARLCGARLVTAVETDEGRRWDAAKIKAMTGGDTHVARFMRQDFFEFAPQYTPIVHGNQKPRLKTQDEGTRRRLHMVPFDNIVPPHERDKQLSEKLKAEWPGILRWMIDGCMEWQRVGLSPPARVTEATEEYFRSQDTLEQWLNERCEVGPNLGFTNRTILFNSWKDWAMTSGEDVGTANHFYDKLDRKEGVEPHILSGNRGFKNIRLLPMGYDAPGPRPNGGCSELDPPPPRDEDLPF